MDSAFRRSYHQAEAALTQALQGEVEPKGLLTRLHLAPDHRAEDVDAARMGDELWAVARLLDGNPTLRRSLADPSREGEDRAGLAGQLLSGKIGQEALHVTQAVVAQRWAGPGALVEALERVGVEAVLAHAERHARLGQVEDELFRFSRIVEGDTDLQAALSDRRAEASARVALVDRLLSVKAAPETVRLARQAANGTRGRRFDRAVTAYLEQAAERQQQVTATVTSAVPLTEEQHARLVRTLSHQYGRQVHTNVVIDADVVGGIRVEIGDEVIDGTVSHRLADARRRMTS